MNKKISIGAIISYFTIGINIVSGIFYTPWMIHTIGDSEYAIYTLAMSIITIFMMDFGLSSATSRFVSRYYAVHDEDAANNFLGITLKLYIFIDIVMFFVLFVLFFCIEIIYVQFSPSEISILKNVYVIVAFYSILSFPLLNFNGILMAREMFVSVKMCGLLSKVFTVGFVVIALLLGGDVYALVLINAGVQIVFSIVKLILVKRAGVRFNLRYKDYALQKEIFAFSIWITVVQLMQRFIFSLAPTFLAMFVAPIEIVYFSLATTIEGYVFTIGDAINGMFMPKIAQLDVTDNADDNILNLMVKVGRFQIFTIGMIIVVFCLVGSDFVTLWMGNGYEKVAMCGIFILIPSLLDIPQQIGKTTILVRDKVKQQANIYICMVIIYIPLVLILTPRLGVIGTSIAVLIAYMVRSILLSVLYHRELGLDMVCFYKKVYAKWTIVLGTTLLIGCVIVNQIGSISFEGFILKCILCMVIYLIVSWLIFFSESEKQLVYSILKRLNKKKA